MAILVHRFFPMVRLRDACARNERALLIAMNPTRREGAVEPRWTSTATRTSGNPACGAGGCTIVLMSHIGERDGDLGVGDPVR